MKKPTIFLTGALEAFKDKVIEKHNKLEFISFSVELSQNFKDCNADNKYKIQENFLNKMIYAGQVIAYLDKPNLYQSIVEIVATSISNRCANIIIDQSGTPEENQKMFDCYGFMCSLPRITTYTLTDKNQLMPTLDKIFEKVYALSWVKYHTEPKSMTVRQSELLDNLIRKTNYTGPVPRTKPEASELISKLIAEHNKIKEERKK